jgi:hypothetical protein
LLLRVGADERGQSGCDEEFEALMAFRCVRASVCARGGWAVG